jgi:hypothetical protein
VTFEITREATAKWRQVASRLFGAYRMSREKGFTRHAVGF